MTTYSATPREFKGGEEIDGQYVRIHDDGKITMICYREFEVTVDELHRIGTQLVNLAEKLEVARETQEDEAGL